MGVCIPEKNNQQQHPITSVFDKKSTIVDVSRYSTNFTDFKRLKSLKTLSNQEFRISKLTKYDDIKKYYNISKIKLGEGGSGIVYGGNKINSKNKNFEYAIKQVLKKNDLSSISLIKEIEINLIIHHNNIVQCFDIFEDDLYVYFVFEYMPEGDLFDYIIKKPEKKLKDKEIIIILEQIFLALIYIHEKLKITHRDIKPENFLLKKENEKIIVKLMDFGTSDFNKKNGFTNITQGTPNYIAPEIYLEEPYTSKVDMWATGVVLYNMATGSHPFQSGNNESNDISFSHDNKSEIEDQKIINEVLNKEINFNVINNLKIRLLAKHLMERDPNKRASAIEAYDELIEIKNFNNGLKTEQKAKTFKSIIKNKINKSPMPLKNVNTVKEDHMKQKESRVSSVKAKFGKNIKRLFSQQEIHNNSENDDEDEKEIKNNNNNNNVITITIKKKV